MTDPEREQANAIITELQERLHRCEGQGSTHSGGIGQSALCEGCYRWRIGFAVAFGAALAQPVGSLPAANRTAIGLRRRRGGAIRGHVHRSLLPVALVALIGKSDSTRLACRACFGLLRTCWLNSKKGLRE